MVVFFRPDADMVLPTTATSATVAKAVEAPVTAEEEKKAIAAADAAQAV